MIVFKTSRWNAAGELFPKKLQLRNAKKPSLKTVTYREKLDHLWCSKRENVSLLKFGIRTKYELQ